MRTKKESSSLSATREDYIRAVYKLQLETGGTSVTEIAKSLKLSKSTVSERLKELVQARLVVAKPYSKVSLTKKGLDTAEKLTFKHRVIEVFLHEKLKVPKGRVHQEAHILEHAFSGDVILRLAKFLDYPEHDPHGSAIPKIKKWN